jgi:DNA-binding CsgD family transcriptional regulator
MVQPVEKPAIHRLESLPPLPLGDRHWQAIVASLRLSPQQARIVELILRSAGTRHIAVALGISEPTVKTYLQRVFTRLGVRDRVGLAMRVLAVSHEVADIAGRRPKG